MPRVEQKIGLSGNEGTRHAQHSRGAAGSPIVSNCLHLGRRGIRLPIPRQLRWVEFVDVGFVDRNFEENILLQKFRRVQVNQYPKHSQGLRLRGVDHGSAGTIPSAAVETGTFSSERGLCVLLLGDPPGRKTQEKTPCSTRPIRSSTSLAPNSVRA